MVPEDGGTLWVGRRPLFRESFTFELVLEVEAKMELVDAPGVVRLIRNALDFRRADGLVIMSGPTG